MKLSHLAWYVVVPLVALAPLGARVLTRPAPRQHALGDDMVKTGRELFTRDWTANDPMSPGGDGLGPVFNAKSCVACHHQGGVGGGGGLQHNVTTFVVRPPGRASGPAREGVVHARATRPEFRETLKQVHPELPDISQPTLAMLLPAFEGHPQKEQIQFPDGVHVSQRNTPALFGAKLIDELPEWVIIANEKTQRAKHGMIPTGSEDKPVGRAMRLADGRIGRFGWKAQSASLSDFVQAACANELGLGNPGQAQPKPLSRPDSPTAALDLTALQCDQLTEFIASLPSPVERTPAGAADRDVRAGKRHFHDAGCAGCHTPNVGSVTGIYSDLLLHRMGQDLVGGGSYNQPPPPSPSISPGEEVRPDEWRTPPLWGVADSAPYMHDGRAATLEQAIRMHKGQAAASSARFAGLAPGEQGQLIAFLISLRAP